ncbi:MAG TPA: ankyrin repeat domain-containing protein [Pyrinomonadaceae bacterium]
MQSTRIVMRATLVIVVVLAGLGYEQLQAQPSTAATVTTEQEFFDAMKKGDSPRVEDLLKKQPLLIKATYRNGITPVLFAVYAKHKEIAELLISKFAVEPNIFESVATGRIPRVRELLHKDPTSIHAWSADGWTPLHLNFNNIEMAKVLIDAGADLNVNSRNKLNATPLQGAAANNWIELAKLYLSHGANVNCRSEEGISPLAEAAANGFLDFAKLLIENGADLNQKDDKGKTPLAYAQEFKRPEIVKLLTDHGAVQ